MAASYLRCRITSIAAKMSRGKRMRRFGVMVRWKVCALPFPTMLFCDTVANL